jgi:hypothetical protein
MNRSVHFEDKADLYAIEVHDETIDHVLAAKLQTQHPSVT